MQKFIIATNNRKKLGELSRILQPLGIEAVTAKDLGVVLDEVEETGTSFAENAFLKAAAAVKKTGLPAVADDSGICVDALSGRPGIFSARYAGENATDEQCVQKLLSELKNVPAEKRTAQFVCSICCLFPDGEEIKTSGVLNGTVAFEPVGSGGFGYDPVFLVDGISCAEMPPEQKNRISHRAIALKRLAEKLSEHLFG